MILNDAYWEWVAELPSEFKSEEEYRAMVADEACEEMIDFNYCPRCECYNKCEKRSKSIE